MLSATFKVGVQYPLRSQEPVDVSLFAYAHSTRLLELPLQKKDYY